MATRASSYPRAASTKHGPPRAQLPHALPTPWQPASPCTMRRLGWKQAGADEDKYIPNFAIKPWNRACDRCTRHQQHLKQQCTVPAFRWLPGWGWVQEDCVGCSAARVQCSRSVLVTLLAVTEPGRDIYCVKKITMSKVELGTLIDWHNRSLERELNGRYRAYGFSSGCKLRRPTDSTLEAEAHSRRTQQTPLTPTSLPPLPSGSVSGPHSSSGSRVSATPNIAPTPKRQLSRRATGASLSTGLPASAAPTSTAPPARLDNSNVRAKRTPSGNISPSPNPSFTAASTASATLPSTLRSGQIQEPEQWVLVTPTPAPSLTATRTHTPTTEDPEWTLIGTEIADVPASIDEWTDLDPDVELIELVDLAPQAPAAVGSRCVCLKS